MLGALAAPPSFAQEAPASAPLVEPAPSPDEARAQSLYQESSRYYDLGEYERALKGFQDAYLLSGAPALLLNIGQCLRFLERYDEARRSYESYLRVEPESEFRPEVEKLIAQMIDLRDQKQSAQQTSAGLFGVSAWKGFSTHAATDTNPSNAAGPGALGSGNGLISLGRDLRPQVFWYAGGGASFALGLGIGGLALVRALAAREALAEQRELESRNAFSQARFLGIASDIFWVSGVGLAGYGYLVVSKKDKKRVALAPSGRGFSLSASW
jgi:tetratricopeptide (TPR) repeat protein